MATRDDLMTVALALGALIAAALLSAVIGFGFHLGWNLL